MNLEIPGRNNDVIRRRADTNSGERDFASMRRTTEEEESGNNEGNIGKRGGEEEDSLENQMERLKAQIKKTTLEIDRLYESVGNASTGSINVTETAQNETASIKEKDNQTNNTVIKKIGDQLCYGNNCGNSLEVTNLRNRLKLERSVRSHMVRILALEKLENERKTKVLRAILKYYHPDNKILKQLNLPTRLKRLIIAERIKLLPMEKQIEFARRIKKLRNGE